MVSVSSVKTTEREANTASRRACLNFFVGIEES
jgi:hypothetical protein